MSKPDYSKDSFPVRFGIDDIATETGKCDGWTYFCIPEIQVDEFVRQTAEIRRRIGCKAFHGKKYKRHLRGPYLEFLHLIHNSLMKSAQAMATCVLLSDIYRKKLQMDGIELLSDRLEELGLTKSAAVEALGAYLPPLMRLAEISTTLAPRLSMKAEVDDCSNLGPLEHVIHEGPEAAITRQSLLNEIYNRYAAEHSIRAAQCDRDGIAVMSDSKSALIQAADVFGNFSMAHLFVSLGSDSNSRNAKAELIDEVFGDWMESYSLGHSLELVNGELCIKPGKESVTFRAGYRVVSEGRQ